MKRELEVVAMPDLVGPGGMGWVREFPSIRDLDATSDEVPSRVLAAGQSVNLKSMHKHLGLTAAKLSIPSSVDLRPWCSPVENQGNLGSCTANAATGLVEYFERRAFGKHIDASRLFIYKSTRNLLHWTGDTGAYLRTTMGALVLFGAPPEEYWPYNLAQFDVEPPAFCYAFGQSFQSIMYYRLDPIGTTPTNLLARIKTYLAAGLPSMFGFTVYSSINQAATTGKIPFPVRGEQVLGGHAVDAIGYDDNIKIKNSNVGGAETTGALLIRNSWGTGWGPMGGYLWIPYEYVLKGLAVDWWSVLKNEWVDTGKFKL